MDKIKRFIDCTVPVMTCNLRCKYCYITQERKFLSALPSFQYSARTIGKSLTKKRMGGVCHFNLCGGGETLLPPEMKDIIYEMLAQGHYLAVVTNGTVTKRFEEICRFPKEYLERLLFKFSFHYLELKRLNMIDKFFENVQMVKDSGCSFSVELTPNDEYIEYIDDIKKICIERIGAPCHVTVARKETDPDLPILTDLNRNDYINTWEQFDSNLFKFKMKTFNVKRKEFCYGGEWTAHLNLGTGIMKQCYCGSIIQNIFKDTNKVINWEAIGNNCAEPHCHNAHVWLTLGAIPELETPTYASMRNRVEIDGTEWLNPRMKAFLGQKLQNNNIEYTEIQKKKANRNSFYKVRATKLIRKPIRALYLKVPSKIKIKLLKSFYKKHY